ncbi:MAG: YigZ family protein [bacterium]|nr:YigZ family protein [bacterium]
MKSIARRVEHEEKVKRSRFVAVLYPTKSLDDVKKLVAKQKHAHRKARHHCWACRVFDASGTVIEQARDDGEVGRPGMVLLQLLRREDLEGAVVVSRFFGGVKLGPGGVARAFRAAGEGALEKLGLG